MKTLGTICVLLLAASAPSISIDQANAFDGLTYFEAEGSKVFQQEVLAASPNPDVPPAPTIKTLDVIPPAQSQTLIPAVYDQDRVLVLKEIYVADPSTPCGKSPFPQYLPLGTSTLTRDCKRNEPLQWAEAGVTLKFSYPFIITGENPGKFTADAFGGFLWNIPRFADTVRLTLKLDGDVWSNNPDCTVKKEDTKTVSGSGTKSASIHLNATCDYQEHWWIDDETTFGFYVNAYVGGSYLQPGFYLWLNYKEQPGEGPFTLFTPRTGTGSGTVSSTQPGINCGTDCSESYTPGTSVTLTAKPDSGSTFTGWDGGDCAGTGTCTVTMDKPLVVAANFLNINIKKPPPPIAAINELLLLAEDRPGKRCGYDKIMDCALKCWEEATISQIRGDGICDTGIRGPDLYCDTFGMDNEDCEGTVPGKPCGADRVLNCSLECVNKTLARESMYDTICDIGLNCGAFNNDGEACKSGALCGDGIIVDCLSQCVDEAELLTHKADNNCDAALNCAAFNFDEGDCGLVIPGADCGADRIYDCFLSCEEILFLFPLMGDGYCDPELNCEVFNYDAEDCKPGAACGVGVIVDCLSQCVDEAELLTHKADNNCDAALNCAAFNFDNGDCP